MEDTKSKKKMERERIDQIKKNPKIKVERKLMTWNQKWKWGGDTNKWYRIRNT